MQKMLRQLILLLLLRTTPAAEPCLDVAFEINDLSFDGDEFVVALSLARARFVGNATAAAAALLRDGLRRSIAGRVADAVVEELAPAALATAREVAAAQVAAPGTQIAVAAPASTTIAMRGRLGWFGSELIAKNASQCRRMHPSEHT